MKYFLMFLLFSNLCFSQDQQSAGSMLEQMIQQQKKMLEMMKEDSSSFDEYVNKMFERMRGSAFGTFDGDTFQLQRDNIRTSWEETPGEFIYIIQYKKGDSVNIDIKDGMVILSGMQTKEVKNQKGEVVNRSQSSFQRSESIPSNVDIKNPEFKNKKELIQIVFKKISSNIKNPSKTKKQPLKRQQLKNIPGTKKEI